MQLGKLGAQVEAPPTHLAWLRRTRLSSCCIMKRQSQMRLPKEESHQKPAMAKYTECARVRAFRTGCAATYAPLNALLALDTIARTLPSLSLFPLETTDGALKERAN